MKRKAEEEDDVCSLGGRGSHASSGAVGSSRIPERRMEVRESGGVGVESFRWWMFV